MEAASIFSTVTEKRKYQDQVDSITAKYGNKEISFKWVQKNGFIYDCLRNDIDINNFHLIIGNKTKLGTVFNLRFQNNLNNCLLRLADIPVMLV